MKNAKGFYTKSLNMRECEAQGKEPYANIAQSELKAADINWGYYGIEWHHNGNYIAFFANTNEDIEKIEQIKIKLAQAKQNNYFYKSKAQAMSVVDNLPSCEENEPLAIRVKNGKYGDFVCTDSIYFSEDDSFVKAENNEQKEAIERVFQRRR